MRVQTSETCQELQIRPLLLVQRVKFHQSLPWFDLSLENHVLYLLHLCRMRVCALTCLYLVFVRAL